MKILKTFLLVAFFTLSLGIYSQSEDFTKLQNDQEVAREKLLSLLSGEWVARGLYVAAKLGIADHLDAGPREIDELARTVQVDADSLHRLLHMLAGFGIFQETAPGVFSQTEASRLLSQGHSHTLHGLTLFHGEEIHQAIDQLLDGVQSGATAFEKAFHQPVFRYFKENPPRAALFQKAMKEKSAAVIHSAVASYDFSHVQTVYDIGGGYGTFMIELQKRYPQIIGTIFELPEVIQAIRQRAPSLENQRCHLVAGDFFEALPSGGDVYFLKSVLHDWDDARCETILRNCHQAMAPGSKLLIAEIVLQSNDLSTYANCMDVLMMVMTGGKERSLASFSAMLQRTGFVLEGVYPTSTEFFLIEAIRTQDRGTGQGPGHTRHTGQRQKHPIVKR